MPRLFVCYSFSSSCSFLPTGLSGRRGLLSPRPAPAGPVDVTAVGTRPHQSREPGPSSAPAAFSGGCRREVRALVEPTEQGQPGRITRLILSLNVRSFLQSDREGCCG